MPAVLPQTKETRLKSHQVKVKQLEETELWKLKEKLEETNKLAMETNQTVAKISGLISGFASLDKGTPKQRMEMESIRHMAREFDGEWST